MPPTEFAGQFGKFNSPLVRPDRTEVKTPEEWAKRRDEIRKS